ADQNAKIVIDTIIRNTKIGDKLIAHYQKAEKLSLEAAMKKLEELTPLAKNPKLRATTTASSNLSASAAPKPPASISPPPPAPIAPAAAAGGGGGGVGASSANTTISLTGNGTNYSK
ncbi:MAG: hypothetical protein M3129_06080, partial [Thermoproteota archaeon]|nr:hypothetical protein [Thermoproteota archaeon]